MPKSANIVKTASTQEHLDVADVRDDTVLLKSGGACAIIRTTAVNFGLLSETEQDAIIYAYAGFLNSLSFPIQILIQSKKMDITSYLELIKQQALKQTNSSLKGQIEKYQSFIASIIQENKILDKSFYIVVPFSPLELGIKGGTTSLFGGSSKVNYSAAQMLDKAKTSLAPRKDNICRLLNRMGLKAEPLSTTELIKLFYEIYNPEEAIGQRIVSTQDYQSPLVQPVVEMPGMRPHAPARPQPHAPVRPQAGHPPRRMVANTNHAAQRVQAPHQVMRQVNKHVAETQPVRKLPPHPAAPAQASVNAADVQSVLSKLQSEVSKMQQGGN